MFCKLFNFKWLEVLEPFMIHTYFDYNATTPLDPAVFTAMEPYLRGQFGNPSSLHQLGQQAARAVKEARRQAAALVGAHDDSEIIFTSGGTESNNAALRSALQISKRNEIVMSAVEHSSIRKLCQQLAKEGYMVHEIGVDRHGVLDEKAFEAALTDRVAVVSLMMANNETGVIFPVEEIGKKVKAKGILFHVDAVQAVGKCAIDLKKSAIDFLSASAHKIYGPKGAGFLYVRKGVSFHPLVCGGGQERGRRAGTENVPALAGLGKACQVARQQMALETEKIRGLRNLFETEVQRQISGVSITAINSERLSNTSHICFKGIQSETLLIALDQREMYASSGSACMSGAQEPSPVLKAMGFSDEEAASAVRFSFGRFTTETDILILIQELREIVDRLRGRSEQTQSHSQNKTHSGAIV
jgi:cysteine desulfurase